MRSAASGMSPCRDQTHDLGIALTGNQPAILSAQDGTLNHPARAEGLILKLSTNPVFRVASDPHFHR